MKNVNMRLLAESRLWIQAYRLDTDSNSTTDSALNSNSNSAIELILIPDFSSSLAKQNYQ